MSVNLYFSAEVPNFFSTMTHLVLPAGLWWDAASSAAVSYWEPSYAISRSPQAHSIGLRRAHGALWKLGKACMGQWWGGGWVDYAWMGLGSLVCTISKTPSWVLIHFWISTFVMLLALIWVDPWQLLVLIPKRPSAASKSLWETAEAEPLHCYMGN